MEYAEWPMIPAKPDVPAGHTGSSKQLNFSGKHPPINRACL